MKEELRAVDTLAPVHLQTEAGSMDDGITPQGQMELRLEAFQDTGLTDLEVEPCSTVRAKYVFSDTNHYVFTVSPAGSSGVPGSLGTKSQWEASTSTHAVGRTGSPSLGYRSCWL
jgi:hypothetical protein